MPASIKSRLTVIGAGTILLQWKAFLFFFGWTPDLLSDMAVLPWRIEKQNDMHSDLRDMAEDFHMTDAECWSRDGLSAFLKRRAEWEATRIKNKATFSGVGIHCGLAVTVTVRPAGAGTGIVFHRTDLAPPVSIEALVSRKIRQYRFVSSSNCLT